MKKIFNALLFFCTLFFTSCGSFKVINVEKSSDYFSYSIGEGQTVYLKNNSLNENEELCNYTNSLLNKTKPSYKLKSVITDTGVEIDENILKIEIDDIRTASITCLNPFDGVIKIKKIIYKAGKVQIDVNYNIELRFKSDFQYLPPFPTNYFEPIQLGVSDPRSDLIVEQRNRTFYIRFSKQQLSIEKEMEFVINNISLNTSLAKLRDIEYAIIPDNFQFQLYHDTIEYNDFLEPLDLLKSKYGSIIKFNLDIVDENVISIGCDLNFDIRFNGDNYCVPYNIFYSFKHM